MVACREWLGDRFLCRAGIGLLCRGFSCAELVQEFGCFELVPGGAVGCVAFHDGDYAFDDAPAVVGLLDDVPFQRLREADVGCLLLCRVFQLCDHMFVL